MFEGMEDAFLWRDSWVNNIQCLIYAPVGGYNHLLAYLAHLLL